MASPSSGPVRVDESIVFAELEDEAVLLNLRSGIYFGLDPVGTQIWRLLADGASEQEIVERLVDDYDVEGHRLRADLVEFLHLLEAHGLTRPAGG